jgi:hypothetical protein
MTVVNSVTDLSRAGEIAVVTINSPPVNAEWSCGVDGRETLRLFYGGILIRWPETPPL